MLAFSYSCRLPSLSGLNRLRCSDTHHKQHTHGPSHAQRPRTAVSYDSPVFRCTPLHPTHMYVVTAG